VFPSESGSLRQSAFSRGAWAKAVRAAGLDPPSTFHALRHTHAALSIQAGASVLALSRRLGHAKPSITLDVYSHLYEGADSEIADGLDRLWTAAV
jgi:integrase